MFWWHCQTGHRLLSVWLLFLLLLGANPVEQPKNYKYNKNCCFFFFFLTLTFMSRTHLVPCCRYRKERTKRRFLGAAEAPERMFEQHQHPTKALTAELSSEGAATRHGGFKTTYEQLNQPHNRWIIWKLINVSVLHWININMIEQAIQCVSSSYYIRYDLSKCVWLELVFYLIIISLKPVWIHLVWSSQTGLAKLWGVWVFSGAFFDVPSLCLGSKGNHHGNRRAKAEKDFSSYCSSNMRSCLYMCLFSF